jgi:hypothetical protein
MSKSNTPHRTNDNAAAAACISYILDAVYVTLFSAGLRFLVPRKEHSIYHYPRVIRPYTLFTIDIIPPFLVTLPFIPLPY